MIEPSALIAEARTWLGVPFIHQGRSRVGVDCAGFVVELMRAAGELPADFVDPPAYGRRPNGELLQLVARHCRRASRPQPGVLVLIRWRNNLTPSHAALLTGDTLIHAYQRARGVVENSYRGPWLRDTHSLWLLPGVMYV